MAKKFLEMIEDAFEEDALTDIIPSKPRKRSVSPAPKKKSRKSSKKNLRANLSNNLNEITAGSQIPTSRKKSFLATIEEALEDNAFDDIFPKNKSFSPKERDALPDLESPFRTMITTEVLSRAKEIAQAKGIRVKDVINVALQRYVDMEYKKMKLG